MATALQEQETRSAETGVPAQEPASQAYSAPELTRPEEAATLRGNEAELKGFLAPVQEAEPEEVLGENGEPLLNAKKIPTVAELTAAPEDINGGQIKTYRIDRRIHQHLKNVASKVTTWIVEQILRREKKEARQGE